jgi:CBS domain containing-hemolysin-like protein
LLYPLIYVFIWSAEWIIKYLFKIKLSESEYIFTIVDLDEYIRHFVPEEPKDEEVQQEIQMFHNAMEFRNIKLRECMVPRTEIVSVEESDPIEDLMSKFIESEFSRILVYRESIDNIVGYAHSFEMFRSPQNIKEIIKPVFYVPETMLASNAMNMFIENHRSVAVVVDEFGGTSGIVTMEDVMEEIFGEIDDEFDTGDMAEQKIDDHTFIFSARLEIDYINDKFDLDLPVSSEYETLAGFIIHHHESIPHLRENITITPFVFDIIKVSGNKIEQVKLTIVR